MVKNIDGGEVWNIWDNVRDGKRLIPNESYSDQPEGEIELYSNGFKLTSGNAANNEDTCIYMAFAEKPPTVPTKVKYEVSSEPKYSLRFEDNNYLVRTPTQAGNRQTFTYSLWIKPTEDNSSSSLVGAGRCEPNSNPQGGQLIWLLSFASGGLYNHNGTQAVNTEINAYSNGISPINEWQNLVILSDTTDASERIVFYLNGKKMDTYHQGSGNFHPAVNFSTAMNNTVEHQIGGGWNANNGTNYFEGYMANVHLIDGSACSPDSFGKYENGKWVAK